MSTEPMTSRGRLAIALKHGIPDRLPMMDSFWGETIQRWHGEGLPEDAVPEEFFGLERIHDVGFDHSYRLPEEVVSEDDTFMVHRNSMGMLQRFFKGHSGAPEYLEHLIHSREEWKRYKPLVATDTAPSRVPEGGLAKCQEAAAKGFFTGVYLTDPIWTLLHSCGFEDGLMMMIEDPGLAGEIVMTFAELQVAYLSELVQLGFPVQGIFVYGDIGCNTGPFFSNASFDEVLAPAYKLLFGYARSKGWTGMLHSDGDVRPFMSRFIDCFIDALHPFDSRAGMDVRELKPIYGDKLTFIGNISKDIMHLDRTQIEEEVRSKLEVAMVSGGYVYHSDHSVPPGVPMENYLFVLECVRKYGVYR